MDRPPSDLPRRERERLARRRAMLAAARDVFAERGFVGATLDEVAERAEFGKGTLYNYFPGGKGALLRAVLDDLFDELAALLEPLRRAPVPDTEAFRAALRAYLARSARFFFGDRALFHLLVREAWRLQLSADGEGRDYLRAQVDRSVGALGGFVERAVASGAVRPVPARPLAHVILVSVADHVAAREAEGWPPDPDAAAEEAADFLAGLLVDGVRPLLPERPPGPARTPPSPAPSPMAPDPHARLLERRAEILAAARSHHAARGRGALVAVHADGLPQFAFYRAPGDLDAPDAPGGLAAIRGAIRAYDPEREAVVVVADAAREAYSCWRVGGTDGEPEAALVWAA